ncbi:MAG: type II CAAX endopeptidase family protein [Anaerolineae bacterium]
MKSVDTRRILIYIAFSFGLAWLVGLVIYLTGGLVNSPMLVPLLGLNLAALLLALGYMPAPAIAHVLTRLVTKEGWKDVYLRPKLARGWPYWAAAWLGPVALIIAGGALYFALFPQHFDPTMAGYLSAVAQTTPVPEESMALISNPWFVAGTGLLTAVIISPLVNSLFTFGEEFGWRAYLQPKLMPLGGRRAMLLMGLIWGVWHWPVILMGHNYGLSYPGAPYLGPLAMTWFTFAAGTFLGWLTLKAESVWPAVIGHAMINGMAGLPVLFITGQPNPILGPLAVGVIGGAFFSLFALLVMIIPGALPGPQAAAPPETAAAAE